MTDVGARVGAPAQPCNAECFDCSALKPGWAVLPHGVFVCIDCAQIHRNIGRHVSQTKAINTGTYLWYPHEMQVMREIGNGRALRALVGAPPKPSRDQPPAEKEAYCRLKYEERRWGPFYDREEAVAPQAMPPTISQESVTATAKACASTKQPPTPAAISSRRPKAGLAQAKRVPPATASPPALGDLISLDAFDAFEPFKAAAPSPPASLLDELKGDNADWAVWEEPTVGQKAAETAQWDSKKAAVLAHFGQHMPAMATIPLGPTRTAESPALFFASYGL